MGNSAQVENASEVPAEEKPVRKKFVTNLAFEDVDIEINGQIVLFRVSEITGAARDKLMNVMKLKSDGNGNLKDFTDHKGYTLSACMKNLETGKQVTLADVREWGVVAQDGLFALCQKLNGFDIKSETDEKKS